MTNINMFWIFANKKRVDDVREETRKGFESVKKDILSISEWIKHLDDKKTAVQTDVKELKTVLSSIKEEIKELREIASTLDNLNINSDFKQTTKTNNHLFNRKTDVYNIQSPIQTTVQTLNTLNLDMFSITERAILGVLLNSDLKLSYEDLATLLGKEKSTIRGQINTIKSKSESLVMEIIEKNGKKRVYIPKELKERLLKKAKVRVKNSKKTEEDEK